MDPIAVHFHEIALKGKNRARFERALRDNLSTVLRPLGNLKTRSIGGRVIIDGDADENEVLARARDVFGVAHVIRSRRIPRDLDQAAELVLEAVKAHSPRTFRVATRRHDKRFPITSVEVDRTIGAKVHEATGIPVKLLRPELEVSVVILDDEILVGTDKQPGAGGLPVGTGGRVMTLLSGGIDSPVAAWRMMKRGCHVDFVHFHSHPLVDRKSIEKAEELAEILTKWQFTTRLHLVPLADIQTACRLSAPAPLRVLLYRRFMVRIAEILARKYRCRALVTGESLGQVASQTLSNLAAVDAVSTMPILRPLVAMDKQEIIDQSHRIGTFEVSIEPDTDCCQLFLPPKPALHSSDEECTEGEKDLDVETLVRETVAKTETLHFRWPG